MTYLHIERWTGRLGNNICQLMNCIQIIIFYNYRGIIMPNHEFFNKTQIIINEETKDNTIVTNSSNFFNRRIIKDIDENLFKKGNGTFSSENFYFYDNI